MTQDSLEKLAAALAAENDGAHVAPELTRTRIMTRLALQRKKRRFRLVLVAPLLGLGIGSTALAALNSDFRSALSSIPAIFSSAESPPDSPATGVSPPPGHASTEENIIADLPPEATPPPVSESQEAEQPEIRAASPAAANLPDRNSPNQRSLNELREAAAEAPQQAPPLGANEVPAPPALAPDIGLELYRQAHDAQFKTSNYSSALHGYRAYLREHPGGALSVEASYNAALCEVRLGQTEAARRSLIPFARGAHGSYRQEEARALLEALPALESPTP